MTATPTSHSDRCICYTTAYLERHPEGRPGCVCSPLDSAAEGDAHAHVVISAANVAKWNTEFLAAVESMNELARTEPDNPISRAWIALGF